MAGEGAGDKENCGLGQSGFRTELIQANEGLGGGRSGSLSGEGMGAMTKSRLARSRDGWRAEEGGRKTLSEVLQLLRLSCHCDWPSRQGNGCTYRKLAQKLARQ